MTAEQLTEILASHRTIGQAPRNELRWLAEHGTIRQFQTGEVASRHTDVVDGLYVILSGRMSIHMNRGSGRQQVMEWRGGDVTGMLPYSRMVKPPGDTIVDEPTQVLSIGRALLPELIRNCYEVTAILVHVMTDRARRFTSADLRDEKMISLGKLAAGLAHEVNNPASAVMRDVESLASALEGAEEAARALFAADLDKEELAAIAEVREESILTPASRLVSGLVLSDREDVIAAWLSAHGIVDGPAEEIARSSMTTESLDRLAGALRKPHLDAAIRWIVGAMVARSLVMDIERAASRIHELVAAAKGFTRMDHARVEEAVHIAAGLADSVALLDGKARKKSVAVTLNVAPDLPPIRGYGAELNQIWMNLVDNAIDAAPAGGHVSVTAAREGTSVSVCVTDDGPGVPPEHRESIFDPFFTTKPVGEGTGLGLDIVRRVVDWHNGRIELDSQPGRTQFCVRIPVLNGE